MAETDAASPFNWMIMVVCSIPISMTFHSLYIILLIGLMGKDVPLSKRPINILLLIDELLRLVGSAGTLIAAILATIWREAEVANSKNFGQKILGSNCYSKKKQPTINVKNIFNF